VVVFLALIGVVGQQGFSAADTVAAVAPAPVAAVSPSDDRCTPPAFAVALGHVEKWKLHNNCK
jgi:hypothetical protein